MSYADEARPFEQGFSCSQVVLAEDFGLDRNTALQISQGFGWGGC